MRPGGGREFIWTLLGLAGVLSVLYIAVAVIAR